MRKRAVGYTRHQAGYGGCGRVQGDLGVGEKRREKINKNNLLENDTIKI